MPSVSRPRVGAGLAIGLALMVCGCTTTQTTAARLQLNDSRLRAVAQAVHVAAGQASRVVRVAAKTFIPRGGAFQVAVTLENHSAEAVSDLPISVGYILGGRTVYLNGATGLDYFDNHIPSVAAHASLTWVDAASQRIPRGARTFARVGAKASIALKSFTPPLIRVAADTRAHPHASTLAVTLVNASSITQYQLPVYAVVTRRGRIVEAIHESVADLGGGAKAMIHLTLGNLVGAAGVNSIRVAAPATIFK